MIATRVPPRIHPHRADDCRGDHRNPGEPSQFRTSCVSRRALAVRGGHQPQEPLHRACARCSEAADGHPLDGLRAGARQPLQLPPGGQLQLLRGPQRRGRDPQRRGRVRGRDQFRFQSFPVAFAAVPPSPPPGTEGHANGLNTNSGIYGTMRRAGTSWRTARAMWTTSIVNDKADTWLISSADGQVTATCPSHRRRLGQRRRGRAVQLQQRRGLQLIPGTTDESGPPSAARRSGVFSLRVTSEFGAPRVFPAQVPTKVVTDCRASSRPPLASLANLLQSRGIYLSSPVAR